MENVATYSEARSEYTKQLATFIVPSLVGWFQATWARNAADRQRCLVLFQSECEEVARWNTDRVHDEVRVLVEKTGCDYMEELVTAVFIAHTKVLTAVRLSAKEKKLSITVPKLDHFIHRIFREAARTFWKSPFLFMDAGSVLDRQKNVLQIEALATEAITTAVRGLLPVKQILKDYLEGDTEELEDEVVPAVAAVVEDVEPVETPAATEEVKEDKPAAAAAAAAPAPVSDVSSAPAIIQIDTEKAVKFSDVDDVFGEHGEAEVRARDPNDEDDDDDAAFGPADAEILEIDEGSAKPIAADDMEDLDAPAVPPKPATVADDDMEILE
ncbi:hypothetical protein EBX31_00360 [bacterium]|nr:hypothetical protein [bacterium]